MHKFRVNGIDYRLKNSAVLAAYVLATHADLAGGRNLAVRHLKDEADVGLLPAIRIVEMIESCGSIVGGAFVMQAESTTYCGEE